MACIDLIDASSILKLEPWNVAEYGEENLTNNAAEGGNHRLSVRLGTHPNWWTFISKIKSEFQTAEIKLRQAQLGLLSIKHTKRTLQVMKTRKQLKDLLADGVIDLCHFMRAIGACGSKCVVKGKLVHHNDEQLTRSTLNSINVDGPQQRGQNRDVEHIRGRRGRGQARGQNPRPRRQCPDCNGEFAASYYLIHRSRFCPGEGGEPHRRGRGRGRARGRGRGQALSQDESQNSTELEDLVIDVSFDNIINEIDDLEISVFEPNEETNWEDYGARPRTNRGRVRPREEDMPSPPRTRLRTIDEGGPSSRTRSSTLSQR